MTDKKASSRHKFPNRQGKKTTIIAENENAQRIPWTPFVIAGIFLGILAAAASSLIPQISGWYVLGGIIALALAIIIFQKPEFGVYLLIITVFMNISDLFTERGFPSINQPLIVITFLSILANYIIRPGNLSQLPKLSRVELSLLAFYMIIVISSFITIDKNQSISNIIDITKDIIVGGCVFIALNSKEKWKNGMWILIAAISILSLLGVFKMATGIDFSFLGLAQKSTLGQIGDDGNLRYGGPIGASNIWGQVLVSMLPLVLYRLIQTKNSFIKLGLLFSIFLGLIAVIYTGSRGALVALLAIFPLIALERRIKISSILVGLVLTIPLLFFLPDSYTNRIKSLGAFFNQEDEYSLFQDEAFIGRRNAMLTGIAMFKSNPILGVGFGNYGDNYWKYAALSGLENAAGDLEEGEQRQAHSLYVEIVSETGLLGILTFTTFFGTLLLGIFKSRKKHLTDLSDPDWANWITACFMAILTFLISGIFLHGIMWRYIWVLIGLAMACLALSENRSKTPIPYPLSQI